MAKIIEAPEIRETFRHRCSCTALLEFNNQDCRGDQGNGPYYICPCCDAWIAAKIVEGHPFPPLPEGGA